MLIADKMFPTIENTRLEGLYMSELHGTLESLGVVHIEENTINLSALYY